MAATTTLLRAAPSYLRLLRSQYSPPERLLSRVRACLAESLRAAAEIPFYRSRLGMAPSPERMDELPVLARGEVPELERSVRSLYPAATRFLSSRTSGSTGMPVPFLFDASHQRGRFAARARYLLENGWHPLRRSAWIIHVRPEAPDEELLRKPRLLGARFFSHTTDLEAQAAWLRRVNPLSLYTYPANLEGLARIFESSSQSSARPLPALRRVFTGSEVLEDSLRTRVRATLGVDIADNYGSTEAFLAWECPLGRYHVNAEHVVLEIVDEGGRGVSPGGIGRVLVTTLENHLMPLIRYEIGDYAVRADGACPCGRTLPQIGRIIGRGINLFVNPDGRLVVPWTLLHVLKEQRALKQYQIVQRKVAEFLVRFVADRELTLEERAAVQAQFEEILGSRLKLDFERRAAIPRAPSGKFMPAISEVGAAGPTS
jgi:phenylacetate-CoA ligase